MEKAMGYTMPWKSAIIALYSRRAGLVTPRCIGFVELRCATRGHETLLQKERTLSVDGSVKQ